MCLNYDKYEIPAKSPVSGGTPWSRLFSGSGHGCFHRIVSSIQELYLSLTNKHSVIFFTLEFRVLNLKLTSKKSYFNY